MLKRLIKLQHAISTYFALSPSANYDLTEAEEQVAAQVDDAYDDDDDYDDDGPASLSPSNTTTFTSNGRRRKASAPVPLSIDEWATLRGLRNELKTFADATEELSAEYSPTAALIWPIFAKLSGYHHSITILSTEQTPPTPLSAIPLLPAETPLQRVYCNSFACISSR
jgi:hypothetical protein